MSIETLLEVVKLLAPSGALAVVFGILALRSPQLIRELFSGINALLEQRNKRSSEDRAGSNRIRRKGRRVLPR